MSKDFIKEIFAIVLSPITTITKMKKDNLLLSRDLLFKAYNEGIYHFTEDESSKKIMESKYLKSSKIITSYGARSCFFFAGIPTLDVLVINGLAISKGNLEKKLIAVKFNLPYEELVKFDYRCINDNALMYRGDYHFNKKDAKIVYLGLKIEDGKGIYKEISKEEYQNYDVDLSKLDNQKLKKRYIAEINLYQMALRKEFYFLKKIIIDILHDERTTAKTYFDRQRIIKENKEEFLNKGNR